MDRLRQLSPQTLKWSSIALFAFAFLAVFVAQRTTSPVDVICIVLAILAGVVGFNLWIMYGERVDGGPRR